MKFKITDKKNRPLSLVSVNFRGEKIAHTIAINPSDNFCDIYKPDDLNWDITFEEEDFNKFRVVASDTGETIWEKTEETDRELNEVLTRLLTIAKDEKIPEVYRAWIKNSRKFILRRLNANS